MTIQAIDIVKHRLGRIGSRIGLHRLLKTSTKSKAEVTAEVARAQSPIPPKAYGAFGLARRRNKQPIGAIRSSGLTRVWPISFVGVVQARGTEMTSNFTSFGFQQAGALGGGLWQALFEQAERNEELLAAEKDIQPGSPLQKLQLNLETDASNLRPELVA